MKHPVCLVFLVLSAALGAQVQESKIAPPLPFVDLDQKVQVPARPPAATAPKTSPHSLASPRPDHVEPVPPSARVRLPGGGSFEPSLPTDRAVFSGDGPGGVYAVGTTYKARFTVDGFTYVPYFGADAPQNYPLTLGLSAVQLGAAAVPLAAATLRREGATVRIARDMLEERYVVGVDRVEQQFVVGAPFAGDLTITLRVDTELEAGRDEHGLRFRNALGSVGFTDAVLIDAAGNRLPMRTHFDQGTLTLHAAAATVARATFPIVVDPVFTTFTARADTTYRFFNPDIAYSHGAQQHLVVWTRAYSANDTDLYSVAVTNAGVSVANSFTVLDGTFDRWDEGRVAVCGGNYLAVASRQPSGGGQREIWGITRSVFSTSTGPQFQISALTGDKVSADVGGEFDNPTNFCVVWQRNYLANDHDIHYRLVSASGTLNGAVATIDNGPSDDYLPTIARCSGRGPGPQQVWPVTWQRRVGTQNDIYGARVQWNGTLSTPPFAIDAAASDNDIEACVTSVTDDLPGGRYWLVAYTTFARGDYDIYLRVFRDGVAPLEVDNRYLFDLEQLSILQRDRVQSRAQADSDGSRFSIAYIEALSTTDHNAYVSTLGIGPTGILGRVDTRVRLTESTLETLWVQLGAERSGGGDSLDYGVAWDVNTNSGPINSTIEGAIYQGATPGGGFRTRATACGGLGITTDNGSQIPGPGRTIRFDVSGGAALNVIIVGTPITLPLCPPAPCALGTTLDVVLSGRRLDIYIPQLAQFMGATVAVQGASFLTTGGCALYSQAATSDTIDVTIR